MTPFAIVAGVIVVGGLALWVWLGMYILKILAQQYVNVTDFVEVTDSVIERKMNERCAACEHNKEQQCTNTTQSS